MTHGSGLRRLNLASLFYLVSPTWQTPSARSRMHGVQRSESVLTQYEKATFALLKAKALGASI